MLKELIYFILISFSHYSYANCEAGGYGIHTKATYAGSAPERTYFVYTIENGQMGPYEYPLNHENIKLSEDAMVGGYTLHQFQNKCSPVDLTLSKNNDFKKQAAESVSFIWTLGQCEKSLKIPKRGYLQINFLSKDIRVGKKIAVGPEKATPEIAVSSKIEALVKDDIHKREINFIQKTEKDAKIFAQDRDFNGIDYQKIGSDFWVVTAWVRIEKTMESWREIDQYAFDQIKKSEKGMKAFDFPFLYFYSKKGNLNWVGDGSSCVKASPYFDEKRKIKKSFGVLLGYGIRFNVSNAFDMDGDEQPDLIEVNNNFTYELQKDGEIRVVFEGGVDGC